MDLADRRRRLGNRRAVRAVWEASVGKWLAAHPRPLRGEIAIHEVGHLVAGKPAGMSPGGIRDRRFHLYKSGRNWVFGSITAVSWPEGSRNHWPSRRVISSIAPFAWMVAGGPLVSILSTAIGGWFAFGGESEIAGTFFWTSALLSVTTLVPYATDANKSDGARILLLLRRPEEARAWIALMMIMAEEAAGALPRDWDPQLCAIALAPAPGAPESSFVQLLAHYRSLDLGREEEAIAQLESCLARSAKSGNLLRHGFFLEAACASASASGKNAGPSAHVDRSCDQTSQTGIHVRNRGGYRDLRAALRRCFAPHCRAPRLSRPPQTRWRAGPLPAREARSVITARIAATENTWLPRRPT